MSEQQQKIAPQLQKIKPQQELKQNSISSPSSQMNKNSQCKSAQQVNVKSQNKIQQSFEQERIISPSTKTQAQKRWECDEMTISTKYLPNSNNLIQSQKIIDHRHPVQFHRLQVLSPRQQLLAKKQHSYTMQYNGDYQQIKEIYVKVGWKRKLKILRENTNSIILRKHQNASFKCIMSLCYPLIDDSSVYQLKKILSKRNKMRFTLISGEITEFECFRRQFCCQLWKKQKMNINQAQAIQFFFYSNIISFHYIAQQCSKFINRKLRHQTMEVANSILKILKENQLLIKKKMLECKQINQNPSAEKKLQQIIYDYTNIEQIYKKVFEKDARQFEQKKVKIKNYYTLKSIFQALEIPPQFRIIEEQIPLSLTLTPQRQKLPYFPAIQLLQSFQFRLAPSACIQLASVYCHRLRNYCNDSKNSVKLIDWDMDNLLPLTIYCVTLCHNSQLLGVTKMMLEYLEDQDDYEPQKKIFTTIEASIQYARVQWKFD